MTRNDPPQHWCAGCGAAYPFGTTHCATCRIRLVKKQPPDDLFDHDEVIDLTYVDHAEVEYDLSGWSEDQRTVLGLLIEDAGAEPEWDDTLLRITPGCDVDIEAMVDLVEQDEELATTSDPS
jgi:hypothetical protein